MSVFTREDLISFGFRPENQLDEEKLNKMVLDISGLVIKAACESKLSYTWVCEEPLRPLVRYYLLRKLNEKFLGCDVIGLGSAGIYINWSPRQK